VKCLTKDEILKMENIVDVVKEAAKKQAFEVAGATAGDCAGDAVVIAVRSSIRRSIVVQKRSGLGADLERKRPGKSKIEDSSSSSSDTDSDTDVATSKEIKVGGKVDKKEMKRKIKMAAKNVEKIAKNEVNAHFGKLAANWAAIAVRQSMVASMQHCVKASHKREKKEDNETDVPMDSGVKPTPVFSGNGGNGAPEFPMTETIPGYAGEDSDTGNGGIPLAEEQAVLDAIAAFKNMGFTPDEKLIKEIRKQKGDIMAVFENMKK